MGGRAFAIKSNRIRLRSETAVFSVWRNWRNPAIAREAANSSQITFIGAMCVIGRPRTPHHRWIAEQTNSRHQGEPASEAQDDKWSFCLTAGTLCPANQERP